MRWGTTLLCALTVALVLALAAAGCGSSGGNSGGTTSSVPGTTNAGPGLQTSQPPWRPEYAHLKQRIRALGLPPAGTERFHIHALLRIYVDGILSPVPKNIGIYERQHIEGSLHTHDETGIIHMESTHPHTFTLGDFFDVWGVKLGPDRVGGLTGLGGDKLHFYLNGRPLSDPAAHQLRADDVIVIGYGAANSFPHRVNTEALRLLKSANGGALACSKVRNGRRFVRCFAPRRGATQSTQTQSTQTQSTQR
ncbi:MAG: hypothetical protein ACTHOE_10870 [Conexibacter sp.]